VDLFQEALGQSPVLLVEDEHAMGVVWAIAYMAMDTLEEVGEVLAQKPVVTLLWSIAGDDRCKHCHAELARQVEGLVNESELRLGQCSQFYEAHVFTTRVLREQDVYGGGALICGQGRSKRRLPEDSLLEELHALRLVHLLGREAQNLLLESQELLGERPDRWLFDADACDH
jgi:hypothetical protein